MKKFILSALCAIAALAGCQKIDENSVNPGQSGLKVTAVIADNSTRVDYEVVDNTVTPKWVVGDEIFGYDDENNTFTFTVTEVDDNGMATFDAGTYAPADGTTLYAVYYPGKYVSDFADGELAVDVTTQDGVLDGTAPAIMCATSTVNDRDVAFSFENQTAIIGLNKFQVNADEVVTGFKASGFVTTGTIKVVDGALKLVADAKAAAEMIINCNCEADGNGMYESPVYFIALPKTDASIVINAIGTESEAYTFSRIGTNIEAGNYYYMSKKFTDAANAKAKISSDGGVTWTYLASVPDALYAANRMSKACTITLMDDYTNTSTFSVSNPNGVTLDLNGKTYTAKSTSRITTTGSGKLIIDGNGTCTNTTSASNVFSISTGTLVIKSGTITSGGADAVSTVNISGSANFEMEGGTVSGTGTAVSIGSSGTVMITGGEITTTATGLSNGALLVNNAKADVIIDGTNAKVTAPNTASGSASCPAVNVTAGNLTLKNGTINGMYTCIRLGNGNFTMDGGKLYSRRHAILFSYSSGATGTATINGGELYDTYCGASYYLFRFESGSKNTLIINDGYFFAAANTSYSTPTFSSIPSNAKVEIYGGYFNRDLSKYTGVTIKKTLNPCTKSLNGRNYTYVVE